MQNPVTGIYKTVYKMYRIKIWKRFTHKSKQE